MKTTKLLIMTAVIFFISALAACGSGSASMTNSNGSGGGGSGASGGGYLNWSGNANGAIIIDAAGNQYEFSSASGCMYLANGSGGGPANFCLTVDASSATGYANYGPTNCLNPQSNSECDAASFDVILTNNPNGSSSCIAVLGNGGANAIAVNPLSVTSGSVNQPGFSIQSVKIATAFTLYDEANYNPGNLGLIPICGGSNPYAGTYLYESTGYCGPDIASNETLTIDSGGIIFSAEDDTWGVITSSGSGSFDDNFPNSGGFVHTFTGATMGSNNLWVLSGTGCLGMSFTLSEM